MYSFGENWAIVYMFILSLIIYIIKYIIEYGLLHKKSERELAIKLAVTDKSDDEGLYMSLLAKKSLITIKLMLFKLFFIITSLRLLKFVFNYHPMIKLFINIHWILAYILCLAIISYTHQRLITWFGKKQK